MGAMKKRLPHAYVENQRMYRLGLRYPYAASSVSNRKDLSVDQVSFIRFDR